MFEFNLYLTLKKHKGDTQKMLMKIERNNPTSRLTIMFVFDNNISRHKAIIKAKS
jgi:hypothetical protein